MMHFDLAQWSDGSGGVPDGMPDENDFLELYDEDSSHQPFDGHRLDAVVDDPPGDLGENPFQPYEESTAYVACATDPDEPQPAVLHECLAVTAVNRVSKKSRRAVLMFDSGSTHSRVSPKLAQLLDIPRHKMRVQNVNTFGSETPMAFNGFRTFLVLRSEHGRRLQFNVTVTECIVSSVRTALVRDADLPAL
ncbi:hypothetical protein AAVH_10817 [Aphelenchoides avenae]|nr:hypothetical protein AAVH_10817 [Aphelenchus avenae]